MGYNTMNDIINKLISLSKIFKDGYTVELNNGTINQYSNTDKPYIVSYLTLIEVRQDKTLYNNIQRIPNNCIIGAWLDTDTNIYYIELNKVFKSKRYALKIAKKFSQKAIYDNKHGVVIWT